MKEKLLEKAISWAKRKGFKKLRANTEEFETPRSFSQPGNDEIITPDVTGFKMGNKSFIEIALKGSDKQSIVSKWKLFSTLAARKGGKLYLLVVRGHKSFAERIVKEYQLSNATVVSL
ncbi:MAG: hypothetical protein AAF573_22580 [Bacteroidota bacterium]